jgi:hypothetical protein
MYSLYFAVLIAVIILVYLILDYQGPNVIILRLDIAFGLKCLRAKELIVQESDNDGNLWASRGLVLYKLNKGSERFIRIAHVSSGLSFYWLNNFTLFRRLTLRPECLEITIGQDGTICAFTAGKMWILTGLGRHFRKTGTLTHFGKGVGRGIMSTGLLAINLNNLYFGEYFGNPERTKVRIYKYDNKVMKWDTAFEFQPGQIRHIHALQSDPFTSKLWICTGDEDSEAMIGWSDDSYKSINPIGQGSQIWRACQLVFTKEAVYWGTDTGSEDLAGIYRWDRSTKNLTMLQRTNGAVFFGTRLANGTIVMSTDREGFPNEKDDRTRLFFLDMYDRITIITCGTWKYKKSGFRFNFAKLRFQRSQDNDSLAISVLNQREFSDGELLLFNEDTTSSLFQ